MELDHAEAGGGRGKIHHVVVLRSTSSPTLTKFGLTDKGKGDSIRIAVLEGVWILPKKTIDAAVHGFILGVGATL